MDLVTEIKPDQCTLVPDKPDQLTSDHGWDLEEDASFVQGICEQLSLSGIRSSLFMDADIEQIQCVPNTGADRIELYTEEYASTYQSQVHESVFQRYKTAATLAQSLGLGVNAGHDLDLNNLEKFLMIDGVLEVSIGHVLTIECIEHGMQSIIKQYLDICQKRTL